MSDQMAAALVGKPVLKVKTIKRLRTSLLNGASISAAKTGNLSKYSRSLEARLRLLQAKDHGNRDEHVGCRGGDVDRDVDVLHAFVSAQSKDQNCDDRAYLDCRQFRERRHLRAADREDYDAGLEHAHERDSALDVPKVEARRAMLVKEEILGHKSLLKAEMADAMRRAVT